MTLSMIVPVYNCENYLRFCLDSLTAQSCKDMEIILADDGSTDESPLICEEYRKRDPRIKVIRKENGGVSSARNAGLAAAGGEYITFVDADDWIDQDACSRIADQIEEGRLLYFWNLKKCFRDSAEAQRPVQAWDSITQAAADIIACPKYQNAYLRAAWAKVYHRKLLEGVRFPDQMYIGEDACFLLSCMKKLQSADQIKTVNDSWYNYRISPGSAVRRYKADLLQQSKAQYDYISDVITEMKIEDDPAVITALTIFSWQIFMNLKSNSLKKKGSSEDCRIWAGLTDTHLKDFRAEQGKMPKMQILCRLLYGTAGEAGAERIVGIYERYKQRKDKYHSSDL